MTSHQAEKIRAKHRMSIHVSGIVGIREICSGLVDNILAGGGLDPMHGIMLVGRILRGGRMHHLRVMTANEAMTNCDSSHYFKIFMRRDARRRWWIFGKEGIYANRMIAKLEKEKIAKRYKVPQHVDSSVIAITLGSSRRLFTMDNAGDGIYS